MNDKVMIEALQHCLSRLQNHWLILQGLCREVIPEQMDAAEAIMAESHRKNTRGSLRLINGEKGKERDDNTL
ncbi:hypothetical protein ACFL0Q_07610 [Thermodesulfobacteriota bacterium]